MKPRARPWRRDRVVRAQRRGAGPLRCPTRSRKRGQGCPRAEPNRPRCEGADRAAAIRA